MLMTVTDDLLSIFFSVNNKWKLQHCLNYADLMQLLFKQMSTVYVKGTTLTALPSKEINQSLENWKGVQRLDRY